jgi:hypothetical protein
MWSSGRAPVLAANLLGGGQMVKRNLALVAKKGADGPL